MLEEVALKARHIPLRTCVVCRERHPKRSLTRIVRTPEGEVKLDASGKLNGRGAYICESCQGSNEPKVKAKLGHALKSAVSQEEMDRIVRSADSIVQRTDE